MKKLVLSALFALSSLSGVNAATLYSSNLGNGYSLAEATAGIASGTVRFGVFPEGFDIEFNSGDYEALNAAFIEVASFSGNLDFNATNGFYSKGTSLTFNNSGAAYDADVAGKKIYIWVLDNAVPASATQQIIASSNQTWPESDAVISDTFASTDSGVAGLTFYVGGLGQGEDIGAGVASHILTGTLTEVTEVALTTPNTSVNAGTTVVLTATADGSPPKTYAWYKNGAVITGQTGRTLTINTTTAQDTGVYMVSATNGETANPVESNELTLTVNTPKPTILTQPVGTVVAEGGTLNLDVEVVGQGTLLYTWKKGAALPGQTSAELELANMSLKQAGAYTVTVTNAPTPGGGSVNSAKAEVVVVSQASNTVVAAEGAKATLTALIAGKGATYQWFKEGSATPLANGTDYTGVTTTKLSVLALTSADSGNYYCRVTVGEESVNSGLQTLNVFTGGPELNEEVLALMPDGMLGATYSYQVPVLGGAAQAPTKYAAKGLPSGLKLDAKTGLITGRPTKVTEGAVTITFTVSNSEGSDTATAQIVIEDTEELGALAGSYVGPVDRNVSSGIFGAELGGRFEMTVTTTGAISGKLFLGAMTLPVKGFIELGGELPSTEFVVLRPNNLPPLYLGIEIDGDYINGYLTSSSESSEPIPGDDVVFDGYRNIYKKKTNEPTEFLGQHNFIIELDEENEALITDETLPQGAGYGIFTVAADGKLSVKGKTADGEAYTTSSFLSPDGDVFIYQTLYKTAQKGSILGKLVIDEENLITGNATQLRPADPSTKQRTYAAGFDLTEEGLMLISGGAYGAPASKVFLDEAANSVAELEFIRGEEEAAADAEADVTLLPNFKLSVGTNSAKTKVAINSKTGLVTGSFTLADKRASKFEGVVIPEEGDFVGVGYYLLPESADKTSAINSGVMSLAVPPVAP